jgi:transcriptional regulator with XRE-family HTH domain
MTKKEKFCRRLTFVRAFNGFTQKELSKKIGCDQSYIVLLESGARNPSNQVISKIAKALKITKKQLITGVEIRV